MTPEKRRRPVPRASKSPSTPKSQQCSTLTMSSPENSSGELVIDVGTDDEASKNATPEKDNVSKQEKPTRVSRRKKRKMSLPDDADALFDEKFEETIRRSAAKNNLTPICVKKLLKKLVMNDHVFAIVRLKEEEESKKGNTAENSQEGDQDGDDEDDGEDDDEDAHTLPKLTRLKAKELNQTIFPLVPLNAPATDQEVAALIREDLNSDDDDEEYRPGEDDVPSDDDPNTTISDIDSQPRTPAATTTVAVTGAEHESELQYTKDGLFKIPKPRNDSYYSQSEQEQENIALRTRSKLCLTTTDIETLESTFIPPDITTDMYEYDGDMDQAWKDFLEEFTKPLPQDLEDDDDNDPEYVAADKVPLDAEEMRAVKVSKKELNELVSELMEMSNIDEPYLEQALNETINESLNCAHIDGRSDMLRTPLPEPPSEMQPGAVAIQSSYPAITEKFPVAMLADHSGTIGTQGGVCSESSINPNVSAMAPNFTPTSRMLTYSMDGTIDTRVDNGVAEYETNDKHNTPLPSTSNMDSSGRFFIKYSVPDETFPSPSDPSVSLKPTDSETKRYRFHTTEVPVNVVLPDAAVGFTDFQMQLLQQQLRMHVQLTAQHFLQTYAHPLFWETAKTCKDMLGELEVLGKAKPNILPFNLPSALECCQSWEDELSVVTESNKLYIKALDQEIINAEQTVQKSNKHYQAELHWRMREKMINCKAFMYPELIPHKTFRLSVRACKQARFTKGELQLIAFWFERASKEIQDDRNARLPNTVTKKPTMKEIINYTIKHFWPNYKWKQLDALVRNRVSIIYSNPIDFFMRNGYAPPFKHVLEHIDVNNVIPLAFYQKGILPEGWDRYISRKMTPIAEHKKQSAAWEIKDKHQQPHRSSSSLPETSDAPSLECKKQVLLPEESCTVSEQVENTFFTPIVETKCESATSGAVEPSLGDVVANASEISISVLRADEPQATKDMHNGVSRKNSVSSSVDSVTVECTCICHSSIEEIHVENLPDGVPSRDELTVGGNDGDKIARQLACPEPVRSVSSSPHDKNVAKHSVNRLAASATLYIALKRYLKELKEQCEQDSVGASMLKPSHPVGKVYAHLLQLDVYARFLGGLRTMCEHLATYCHRYRTLQQYNPQRLSGLLQLFHLPQVDGSLVVSARYISHRFDDYCSMEDKDARYAFNYYEKVEETLLASGRADLLERFEEVLKAFDELEGSVTQLYYHVEDLLGESFPELVEMFLTFLLPGQAAEVGRFFEHFILTNMNDFLEKLNIFFAKQPSQIKKVHACLNELSNEPNVTIDQVKLKVLPLLKGSTLLSEWFLQLFPSERPPESPLCDYENVTLKKPPIVETCEPGLVYEQVPYVEAVPADSTENAAPPNAIRYIQGRIYQGALPARLTFLANNCLTKSGESAQGASGNLEQNLCDEATLKAHAIRLNPQVYCPKGVTYANVAPLLTTDGIADGAMGPSRETSSESVNTEDEPKGASSPKKVPPKLPIKKRFNSPTSRKLTFSPNEESSASTSPGKETATSKKTPSVSVTTVPADSKALSTSKKLKTVIETAPTASQQEPQQEIPLTAPPVCLSAPVGECSLPENGTNGQKSTNGPVTPNEGNEPQEPEPSDSQPVGSTSEGPSWTREEDEIILLKLIKGYTSVDTFVQLIEQQLPERSSQQIRGRVEFLNEMLRRVNQK